MRFDTIRSLSSVFLSKIYVDNPTTIVQLKNKIWTDADEFNYVMCYLVHENFNVCMKRARGDYLDDVIIHIKDLFRIKPAKILKKNCSTDKQLFYDNSCCTLLCTIKNFQQYYVFLNNY